jgi:hypothetical protein
MYHNFSNIFTVLFLIFYFPLVSLAQDPILIKLQEKMDRQEMEQKELVYSFNTITYVHKLDKQGGIEKTDTTRTWQKFKGDSLQEYTLLYSSDKKEEKDEGKKENRQSSQLPKLTDPAYDFLVDAASGKIAFVPKKAKKGDLAGELLYDPGDLTLKRIKATMPKLKWPVKEFEMEIKFIRMEEFLFPAEFRMQVAWNALISSGRIRVESSNTDFKIYK